MPRSLRATSINEVASPKLAIKRSKALIEFFKKAPKKLVDLDNYGPSRGDFCVSEARSCGMAACVGGWAYTRFAPKTERYRFGNIKQSAENFLRFAQSLNSTNSHLFASDYPCPGEPKSFAGRRLAIHRLKKHIKGLEAELKRQ